MEVPQFSTLFQLYYDKVYRLCKGYFNGDGDIASDATQEVFIKVWQHLSTFRGASAIDTWIYRIASNTCLMHLRKQVTKKEVKVAVLPEVIVENDVKEKEDQLKLMYDCISQLEPPNKLIIMMVLEDVPYKEIALVIGISDENLRVRIHRIKNLLTKCVQNGTV
jgi:RNA polymerase sigma factor (sigma-70 family)